MGALFGSSSMPTPPPVPTAPPPPPAYQTPTVISQAAGGKPAGAQAGAGFASTVITGPQGLKDAGNTTSGKTLLGS